MGEGWWFDRLTIKVGVIRRVHEQITQRGSNHPPLAYTPIKGGESKTGHLSGGETRQGRLSGRRTHKQCLSSEDRRNCLVVSPAICLLTGRIQ